MSVLIAWAGDYALYLPLLGIVVLVLGFALRFNPMLVVPVAAITTGLLAGLDLDEVIAKLGKAFNDSRAIIIPWVVLPVIGLLERYGLQQRARAVIATFQAATVGRLLILYLFYRQLISAIGLHSTAGHPQTVRPLVAPMAVAAAERQAALDEPTAPTDQGVCRGDRQCRPVLRRGHLHRDRLDRADPADAGGLPDHAAAARSRALGDPDRDRRLPDPFGPAADARSLAGRTAYRGAERMIGLQHVFYLMGALFAAYALLSLGDREQPQALRATPLSGGWWRSACWPATGSATPPMAGSSSGSPCSAASTCSDEAPTRRARPSGRPSGERYGNRLFLPILIVLVTAVAGHLVYLYVPAVHATGWLEANRETFVLLCLGVLLAIAVHLRLAEAAAAGAARRKAGG